MTAVFSAEYAAELVRWSRNGATFYALSTCGGVWLPEYNFGTTSDDDEADPVCPEDHWVEWYRETVSASTFCAEASNDLLLDMDVRRSYGAAFNEVERLIGRFEDSVMCVATLVRV